MREKKTTIDELSEADLARVRNRPDAREYREAKVFATNLDRLTRMHGMTRQQAAERIGAPYQWYRRVVTQGLRRISTENRDYLEVLADLFHLGRIEDLWRPDLISYNVEKAGLDPKADKHTQLLWRQNQLWPYAEKLGRLLASGQYEFLKELIDKLHETLPKDVPEPMPMAQHWSSDADDEDVDEDKE